LFFAPLKFAHIPNAKTRLDWTAAEAATLLLNCSKPHTSFSGHPRIEGTGLVIMQAAFFACFQRGRSGTVAPPQSQRHLSRHPSALNQVVGASG
jgi:hypothetical protein